MGSYPPHKHDQENLPDESYLEETYYHELNPEQGFVFQRVYTEDDSIDETMTVEHQNVVGGTWISSCRRARWLHLLLFKCDGRPERI